MALEIKTQITEKACASALRNSPQTLWCASACFRAPIPARRSGRAPRQKPLQQVPRQRRYMGNLAWFKKRPNSGSAIKKSVFTVKPSKHFFNLPCR